MPISYDKYPGAKQKHYRRFYPDELEDVQILNEPLIKSPFSIIDIFRPKADVS